MLRDDLPRRALITGAASGIGAATARRLSKDGLDVVTVDRSDGVDHCIDITDAAALDRLVDEVGPIDVLVNSAGIVGPNMPLIETDDDQWRTVFGVNLFAAVHLIRRLVPSMTRRGWGRIVNIASMAGKDGNPNLAIYSASKAAVIGMTKSLGKELATTGVAVNAIAPAVIETPMNANTAPTVLAHLTSLIPMGRLGQPDEVAALIAWLASDECSFSTGAVYDISGGRATY